MQYSDDSDEEQRASQLSDDDSDADSESTETDDSEEDSEEERQRAEQAAYARRMQGQVRSAMQNVYSGFAHCIGNAVDGLGTAACMGTVHGKACLGVSDMLSIPLCLQMTQYEFPPETQLQSAAALSPPDPSGAAKKRASASRKRKAETASVKASPASPAAASGRRKPSGQRASGRSQIQANLVGLDPVHLVASFFLPASSLHLPFSDVLLSIMHAFAAYSRAGLGQVVPDSPGPYSSGLPSNPQGGRAD